MARNAGSQITMNNLKLESINLTSNNLLVTIIEEKERETVLELGEAKDVEETKKYYTAKVLKAGPGFYDSGAFVKNSVNEGDVVIVSTYGDFKKSTVVEVGGVQCYFTDEHFVSAIIR